VLLPHGLSTNARHVQSPDIAARITQVAQWISEVFGGPVKGAFETLAHWSADAGLAGLDALGITEDDRQRAAQAAATSSSMKANPAALTAEDLAALMAAAR